MRYMQLGSDGRYAPVRIYATCKPGERSDLTGCEPAGDSEGEEKPKTSGDVKAVSPDAVASLSENVAKRRPELAEQVEEIAKDFKEGNYEKAEQTLNDLLSYDTERRQPGAGGYGALSDEERDQVLELSRVAARRANGGEDTYFPGLAERLSVFPSLAERVSNIGQNMKDGDFNTLIKTLGEVIRTEKNARKPLSNGARMSDRELAEAKEMSRALFKRTDPTI